MWCSTTQCETGKSNYVSQLAFPPRSDASSSFALCATMNSSFFLVNAPCTFDVSQQFTLPLASSSPTPIATQNLCPYNNEAVFNVTGPLEVISNLFNFLGCTSATLSAWSAAANSANNTDAVKASATAAALSSSTSPLFAGMQPYCVTLGLFEIVFYDGQFTKVLAWRGNRDPYARSTITPAQLVNLLLGQNTVFGVWGATNSRWAMGTSLQMWFRAIDVAPYQPLTLLANPVTFNGVSLAAPWSLMAETDHLVVTCFLGSRNNLGRTLPNNLLSAFKNGVRNLTLQACNISGSLPASWSSVYPLTARIPYVNLYQVYLDLSRNSLSGDLPDSYLSTSWIDCWVTRLDLGSNKLSVNIGYEAASNMCTLDSDLGQIDVCKYFSSISSSVPLFSRGVVYGSGPYNNSSLGTCGLVTSRLGYSGISWMSGSSSSFNSRMFVYSWKFQFPPNSPYADCTLDNSCDLSTTSFEVTNVYTARIPYSLILNGNSVSLAFSNWTLRSLSEATFGMAICSKTIQFGDRVRSID